MTKRFKCWHRDAKEFLKGSSADMFRWLEDGQPVDIIQYTGLKDCDGCINPKTGREIFQGDVYKVSGLGVVWVDICPLYGVVLSNRDDQETPMVDCIVEKEDFEYLGNKYKNPELLTK